ncbi:MAG: ABC transporter permease [Planctomycetaceae bacterium]|nr:ABC transporter permease [Planctomycetaceae bacterium]
MPIELTGYRGWEGKQRSSWRAVWAIVRTGVLMILRRWVFWLLIGLGLLNFIFNFAFIYLKATLTVQDEGFARFLDQYQVTGTGEAYTEFMRAQATITALLLAFAGASLIGADYRQGGMIYYLSRRIERRHYIVGKLLTVATVVTLITTVPALALYVQYGVLSNSLDYFLDNPRILVGILGYGAVLALVQSLLLFAVAAWVHRAVPLVMCWLGIFVLLEALGAAAREINDNRRWLLLGIWRDMHRIGEWCFGAREPERIPTGPQCAAVLAGVCIVCLIVIIRRVRAVEIVR